MQILVTGGAGYIGSLLVHRLLDDGHTVACLDNLSFGGESLLGVLHHERFRFVKGDVRDPRDVEVALGAATDAVVHLAAIVGDPACRQQPDLARAVNLEASRLIADLSRAKGVSRFVFSSTCSNYGRMQGPDGYVDESTGLNPVSLYAETKVAFEQYLIDESTRDDHWTPTSLRFSTVYGLSPRPRFDLTVNEFTRELAMGRKLCVFGEQFWRPYCHVADFAHAIRSVLAAPRTSVAHEVFNVGSTDENYTKKMIVDLLMERFPEAEVEFVQRSEDPRDYRVRFDKIRSQLGFVPTRRVPEGIDEIISALRAGVIRHPDGADYQNVPAA